MKPLAVNRFPAVLALALFLCAGVSVEAVGQSVRSVQTFYARPKIGLSSYIGDRNVALFSFDRGLPFAVGAEFGYQFDRPYSAGLAYQYGRYPTIDSEGSAEARHSVDALFRYTFGGNPETLRNSTGAAPYVTLGAHATFGDVFSSDAGEAETKVAVGPLASVGLDVPLNDRLSFFVEGTGRAAFPDNAADGLDGKRFAGFDLLSTLGAGLNISFESGAIAPSAISIVGPHRLDTDEPGTFSAKVDENATRPVEYRWQWGDGEVSSGLEATHAFSEPGTYTVTFEATNRAGSHSQWMTVTVSPVVVPVLPAIGVITAMPDSVDTATPVQFSAQVEGDAPLSYRWSFGDGNTSMSASPTHTFEEPGRYTVSLQLTNPIGSATETFRLDVAEYDTLSCPQIATLNSVRFETNSAILTEAGQRTAAQNVQTLQACPGMRVRIIGSASPAERNQQALSEDRSRAVMEYYTTNGIPASRITMDGLSNGAGPPPAEPLQRADTVPIR